ncbi:MAG TPA: aminotransferase class V-fold PLP-dependent enzyme [Chitinophagaceae bacterium]|nr:aminotransferase class V-fold PLP-dependent enzyme [Chitinophagaceae bacterium]
MEKTLAPTRTLDISADEFRNAGHLLVDQLARFLEDLPGKKVTSGETPSEIQSILGNQPLPVEGQDTSLVLGEAARMLFEHSLFNGHPRFWGYITSSAAPIGALADMLAATLNPNVGAYTLSPMATEIERQTIKWLAEFIGYNTDCGGIFVSGGNMANFTGFLAGRKNKIPYDIRKDGLLNNRFPIYCAKGTHTWIQKAADIFGHGTDSIRWIEAEANQQMNLKELERQIITDIERGFIPFMVVGNAGSVGTGVVDDLHEIAAICKNYDLWFHIDGAYGAPAAVLPEMTGLFKGLYKADSIAIDPHKWLYSPLEAGCILVKNNKHLHDAFDYNPEYYNFHGDGKYQPLNFHEYGMQNSRGFRALKVWLSLKQAGKNGISTMIRKDIDLAKSLASLVSGTPELELKTQNLSITTFRYSPEVPEGKNSFEYLNRLNENLLNHLQANGEIFLSNAIIEGNYCLRVCIVNFRTQYADLEDLVRIVLREGRKLHSELKTQV